ncbi:MAG TPA: hypothetical protein VI854_05400 [Acidimicrobiia bacterium]|nr:hypothetical protein [Acidimicrobiia bacterium]
MSVYQCPSCELRFSSKSELDMHRSFDHKSREPEKPPEYDDDERK